MTGFCEDDYLMISGIQHFMYCRRQWALIHIENQWEENARTADGENMHERVHDFGLKETRNGIITVRATPVSSSELGISGECDAVELRRSEHGVEMFGKADKYTVTPIEYKRGLPKENDCDIMQLAAQALCLEEMFCCDIPFGYMYYGETKHRLKIMFDDELRKKTKDTVMQMHELYRRKATPKVRRSKSCNACSLNNICLPTLCSNQNVDLYIKEHIQH